MIVHRGYCGWCGRLHDECPGGLHQHDAPYVDPVVGRICRDCASKVLRDFGAEIVPFRPRQTPHPSGNGGDAA